MPREQQVRLDGPRPFLYYVLADLPDAPRVNVSVIDQELGAFSHSTYPHQFDTHLVPAIPLLAYVLNLPRAPLDLFRTRQGETPLTRPDWHAHAVYIIAVQHRYHLFLDWTPALILSSDALVEEARQFAADTGAMLGATSASKLSADLVTQHWQELWRLYCDPSRFVPVALRPELDLSRIADELPRRHRGAGPIIADASGATGSPVPDAVQRNDRSLLSVVCPGVGGYYKKALKQAMLDATPDDAIDFQARAASDAVIERDVLSLLATHSALRYEGEALHLPELHRSAFAALVRAERGFAPKTLDPPCIWRAFDAISTAFRRTSTSETVSRLETAAALKVFSNFPLGLADPGGRGTPLALRTPIAYLPLQPLSSNLGYEFRVVPKVPLTGRQPRILFAECIGHDDPVGRISRRETARIAARLKRSDRFIVDAIDVPDAATLRRALKTSLCDVLVLSAHGATDPERNINGIIIGDQLVTGYEFERAAPVVILSACQVNPLGHGSVSIVAELLNTGALAVAGTMVPICVHRNTLLLERMLTLLADWTGGNKRSNFLEVWWSALHYTSVMDIVLSDAKLTEWLLGSHATFFDVMTPVFDKVAALQLSQAGGYDFYGQAFEQISQAADRQPNGSSLRGRDWRDFVVPESLMYMIFGWPENIIV